MRLSITNVGKIFVFGNRSRKRNYIYIIVNAMIAWSGYMMLPIGQLGVGYVLDVKPCASVLSEKVVS